MNINSPKLIDVYEEDGREVEIYEYKGVEIYFNYNYEQEFTIGDYWYTSLEAAMDAIDNEKSNNSNETDLLESKRIISAQELQIEELRLKAAMYKAYFFHKPELGDRISKQIIENLNAVVGEFDGFCYASYRANAVYRTLEDMVSQGLIDTSDSSFFYEFNLNLPKNEDYER